MKHNLEYTEIPAAPILSPYIRQYYSIKGDYKSFRQLMLADTCAKIFFMRKSQIDFHTKFSIYHKKGKEQHMSEITENDSMYKIDSPAVIIGPSMNYSVLCMSGELDIFVIEFTEIGASILLDANMTEFADKCTPLTECQNTTIKNLDKIISGTCCKKDCPDKINSYFSKKTNIDRRDSENTALIQNMLMAIKGFSQPLVTNKPSAICERQIRRVFKKYVGLSPCEIQRLLRSKKAFLSLLKCPTDSNILGEAHMMGFTDESHLIKEFSKFCGHTPQALQEHCHKVRWENELAFFESGNETFNICKV